MERAGELDKACRKATPLPMVSAENISHGYMLENGCAPRLAVDIGGPKSVC